MKAIGIAAEYNPFHNGHLAQLRLLRDHAPDSAVVSVMSGSFTQRGEISCLDKWTRARSAVKSGVDLVLELPAVYSISSADGFALGSVRTLAAAAVIGQMAFGSEAGEMRPLQAVADFLADESPEMQTAVQEGMKQGLGYAGALSAAAGRFLGQEAEDTLRGSNNILGIAYLKAIAGLPAGQAIKPRTHARVGGSHLDSATHIRRLCAAHRNQAADLFLALQDLVPDPTLAALTAAAGEKSLLLPSDLGPLVYTLLRRSSPRELSEISGMNDGLAERLIQAAARLPESQNQPLYERLVDGSRARHLSAARVQRSLAALILGVTNKNMQDALEAGPQYIRVLAFNKTGRYILKQMSRYATLPIITKGSDFREHDKRGEVFRRQYELDLAAADVRDVLCRQEPGRDFDTAVYIR